MPLSSPRLLLLLNVEERTHFLPDPLTAELRTTYPDWLMLDPDRVPRSSLAARLHDAAPAVIVAAWSTGELPAELPPSLRYVCYLCGSVKTLVSRRQLEQGLLVTNWGNSISRTVAEAALLHVLACLRRTTQWTLAMHVQRLWHVPNAQEPQSLFGRRVGVHGFGAIAREFVALLRPFNCAVSVFAPDVDARAEAHHGVRAARSLEALFAENEVVVELAPLNASTEGSVTESLLRRIPPGGVFVNVGRGRVVDEAGLARVAQEQRIQVGLDVFAEEPLAADSPLRGLPNVSLTPHVAGPTTDRRCDAGAFGVRNLRRFARGEPLEAVITPEVYDRIT